jgi:16S rRNA (cytosine967-C5)-methyltransferase
MVGRILRQGAYTNVLLGHARRDMNPDDARLLSRLTYGTIRHLLRIDRALAEASSRPLARIESEVLDVLRVGAFELLFSNTPPHAAVDEAVAAVRAAAGERAVGFANAVLRKLAGAGEPEIGPNPALEFGVPDWIYRELASSWGESEAGEFLRASQEPAPVTVKSRFDSVPAGGRPVEGIPGAFTVAEKPAGPEYLITDPASVAVVAALAVRPGINVLDVAAAPGGKAIQMADALGGGEHLVAADRHRRRLVRARRRASESGVSAMWVVADGRRPPFPPQTFDRILVDAPCSGLGTLRRRPEIRHRLHPDSSRHLSEIQQGLIAASLPLLRPGGRLVYAVCTVFAEETSQVASAFGGRAPAGLPGRPEPAGWLLGPHLTGTDGMFISVIEPS